MFFHHQTAGGVARKVALMTLEQLLSSVLSLVHFQPTSSFALITLELPVSSLLSHVQFRLASFTARITGLWVLSPFLAKPQIYIFI